METDRRRVHLLGKRLHFGGAMSLLTSLFGAGKSGSAPPARASSVARSDGSKRSGGSVAVNAVDLGVMRAMHKTAREKGVELNEAVDTYLLTAKSGTDGAQGADGDDVMDEQS